jgi:hypothetical protein
MKEVLLDTLKEDFDMAVSKGKRMVGLKGSGLSFGPITNKIE